MNNIQKFEMFERRCPGHFNAIKKPSDSFAINPKRSMYIAYIVQEGEGCDYTIACGQTVIPLKGSSIQEALKDLKHVIAEEYTDERKLESAEIYEVLSSHIVDIDEIYDELDEKENEIKTREEEETERAQYDRLHVKYGKTEQSM